MDPNLKRDFISGYLILERINFNKSQTWYIYIYIIYQYISSYIMPWRFPGNTKCHLGLSEKHVSLHQSSVLCLHGTECKCPNETMMQRETTKECLPWSTVWSPKVQGRFRFCPGTRCKGSRPSWRNNQGETRINKSCFLVEKSWGVHGKYMKMRCFNYQQMGGSMSFNKLLPFGYLMY